MYMTLMFDITRVLDCEGLLVFSNEYGIGVGEIIWYGIGFHCWSIIDNIGSVAKRRVHSVSGR